MSVEAKPIRTTERGDPVLTIEVEGWSDIYRVADGLTHLQVDIARVGYKVINRLRRRCSAQEWTRWMAAVHSPPKINWRDRAFSRGRWEIIAGILEAIDPDAGGVNDVEHAAIQGAVSELRNMASAAEAETKAVAQ